MTEEKTIKEQVLEKLKGLRLSASVPEIIDLTEELTRAECSKREIDDVESAIMASAITETLLEKERRKTAGAIFTEIEKLRKDIARRNNKKSVVTKK